MSRQLYVAHLTQSHNNLIHSTDHLHTVRFKSNCPYKSNISHSKPTKILQWKRSLAFRFRKAMDVGVLLLGFWAGSSLWVPGSRYNLHFLFRGISPYMLLDVASQSCYYYGYACNCNIKLFIHSQLWPQVKKFFNSLLLKCIPPDGKYQ